ncbi:MAG: hypothetical protein QXO87_07315 [Desulfurococcaceae archaeon]
MPVVRWIVKFTDIRKAARSKVPNPLQPPITLEEPLNEDVHGRIALFKELVKALSKEEIKSILQKSIGPKNMPKLSAMIQFLEMKSGEAVSEEFTRNIILLSLLYGSEKSVKKLTFTDLVFQALYETFSKQLKNRINAKSPGLAYTLDLYCMKFNNSDCIALLLDNPEAFKALLIRVYGSLQTVELIAKMYLSLILGDENSEAVDFLVEVFMTDPSSLRERLREMLKRE